MLLLARTTPKDEVTKKGEGLSVFIVDLREAVARGVTIKPIRAMMNHSRTEVFFANLELPSEHLLREEGQGFPYNLYVMHTLRLTLAACCICDARWLLTKASNSPTTPPVYPRPTRQHNLL